jgi:uncharacterized protein YaeQ
MPLINSAQAMDDDKLNIHTQAQCIVSSNFTSVRLLYVTLKIDLLTSYTRHDSDSLLPTPFLRYFYTTGHNIVASKPTIYKLKISLSDLNRHYYDTLNLTLAKHPSETIERMMVRVLAYCINAQDQLTFAKGMDTDDEPAIWARTLDDQILLWIEVGEPAVERIKKASHQAAALKVYCFNSKADVWWNQAQAKVSQLKTSVYRFPWEEIRALVQRTMEISVTITGESAYVATELGECEVNWSALQE